MDSASWQLLKHLWEHNNGLVVAATHTANVHTKKGVDLNLFRELDRLRLIDLRPLGLAATKQIAKAIFDSNGVHKVEDAVYEKLYTMSGGNALFLYELAKAMLEWYHNREDDLDGADPAAGTDLGVVTHMQG
jgi:predicted ATPase